MITVGAFEAKTHLSSLLEKVTRGEEVLITKRGLPVAKLVPAEDQSKSKAVTAIDTLLSLRKELTLGDTDWKSLRDESRR